MNKLTLIQQAVERHFGTKEAVTAHFATMKAWKQVEFEYAVERSVVYEVFDYKPDADAAMLMLRDLLPLLEAGEGWLTHRDGTTAKEVVTAFSNLETEVVKLLEPVEETEP